VSLNDLTPAGARAEALTKHKTAVRASTDQGVAMRDPHVVHMLIVLVLVLVLVLVMM
jgi:hypothetical protein